jgi:hypothetical protein
MRDSWRRSWVSVDAKLDVFLMTKAEYHQQVRSAMVPKPIFESEIDPADFIPVDEDDDPMDIEPINHDEPPDYQRRAALLARLRHVSKATWLLIHDADEVEGWTEQGLRVVEPPADVPADEAVLVLAWGELPEDAEALLRARGLSWHLGRHRYPSHYANE